MSLKLLAPSGGFRARKIAIAAAYGGVDIQFEEFYPYGAPEDVLKEFKKKNPNAKVPVLETPEGPIFESNAILRHVARISKNAKLYGNTKFESALVDQWLDWASTLLEPAFFGYIGPFVGYTAFDEKTHPGSLEKLHSALRVLDGRLAQSKYVAGNTVSIADIQIGSDLHFFFRHLADESTRTSFPHVTKYIEDLANQDGFKNVVGRFSYAKTPLAVFKGELPKREEAKKPEPKKQEPKPKEKKEAAPKKPKKEEEDDDDDQPKEKKIANPLDSLPPSPFNLFDFKTLFVNAPDKKEAFNTFIQLFDPEGYSCWAMQYDKAEGEGNVVFLTSNLMNGFLQRLETFRKYAFGVVGVYGEEPNLEIKGGWVWRGNEIPFEIKDHPSGEWYKFRKLDVKNNEADRKLLEEYWTSWNEDVDVVDGLRARDIKYYK